MNVFAGGKDGPRKTSVEPGLSLLQQSPSSAMVVAVLRVMGRHDLAAFIKTHQQFALEVVYFLAPLEKKGTVPGADYNKLQEHMEPSPEDSLLVATLKCSVEDECALLTMLRLIKDSKELVTYLKSSTHINALSRTVNQEVEARWNSLFTMTDSLVSAYDEVVPLLTSNDEGDRVKGVARVELEWLKDFLRPFKVQTDNLQGEHYPTLPFVVLATERLKKHCLPSSEDSPVQALLRARAARFVGERLRPTMEQKVAAFLWPKYRKLIMLEPAEREEVFDHVRDVLAAQGGPTQPPSPPTSPPRSPQTAESRPAKRMRLDVDDDYDEYAEPPPTPGFRDEVGEYLRDAPSTPCTGIMAFWKSQADGQFSKLARLAHRLLGKPATSAPSERVFSASGFLIQERRTRLAADIIDNIIFLHAYFNRVARKNDVAE